MLLRINQRNIWKDRIIEVDGSMETNERKTDSFMGLGDFCGRDDFLFFRHEGAGLDGTEQWFYLLVHGAVLSRF